MINNNTYKNQNNSVFMVNKLLNVRIPNELFDDAEIIAVEERYGSIQELTRAALREIVERYKVEKAILEINKLRGSAKGKKLRSKKEISEHIGKKYNLL